MNRLRNYLGNKYVWYVAGFVDALLVLAVIAVIIKLKG